jgi:flavin reductase
MAALERCGRGARAVTLRGPLALAPQGDGKNIMSWIDQRPDDAMDGAFTAVAPEPLSCVEPVIFREAMAKLGAAVHVVTTAGPGGKSGFTATAVCSVSDQPALLLVCLNRRSNSAPVLSQNGVFCVNTLGANESALADMFAGRSGVHLEERFAVGEWTTLKTGSPVLASAVVAFDCRTIEVKAVASHNVFFGAVEAVRLGPAGQALVYHDRLYKPV